jgi:hypothetical protein
MNEYGALVEVFGKKNVLMPLRALKPPYEILWNPTELPW